MSARQEKVRYALEDHRFQIRGCDAALAEVEEWETRLAEAQRTRDDLLAAEDEMLARAKASEDGWERTILDFKTAEAEADRLKAALRELRKISAESAGVIGADWLNRYLDAALAGNIVEIKNKEGHDGQGS